MWAALRLQSSTRPEPSHTISPSPRASKTARDRSSVAATARSASSLWNSVMLPAPVLPFDEVSDRPAAVLTRLSVSGEHHGGRHRQHLAPRLHRRAEGTVRRVPRVGQRLSVARLGDRLDGIDLDVGAGGQLLGLGSGPLGGLGPGRGQQLAVVVDRERDALDPDGVARLVGGGVDDAAGAAQVADPGGDGVGRLVAGDVVVVVEHRLHRQVGRLDVVVGDAGSVEHVDHLLGPVGDGP